MGVTAGEDDVFFWYGSRLADGILKCFKIVPVGIDEIICEDEHRRAFDIGERSTGRIQIRIHSVGHTLIRIAIAGQRNRFCGGNIYLPIANHKLSRAFRLSFFLRDFLRRNHSR